MIIHYILEKMYKLYYFKQRSLYLSQVFLLKTRKDKKLNES